jgi:hypothetical protein
MVKSKEEQIRALLVRYSTPPLEVVIPILEKARAHKTCCELFWYGLVLPLMTRV